MYSMLTGHTELNVLYQMVLDHDTNPYRCYREIYSRAELMVQSSMPYNFSSMFLHWLILCQCTSHCSPIIINIIFVPLCSRT